jgi:hypothetical protein
LLLQKRNHRIRGSEFLSNFGDKDKDFWESQDLGTAEGRAQMTALRTGLTEVLPSKTELSEAPVATFFEDDVEAIIAKAEPIIAKDGRRAWIVKD